MNGSFIKLGMIACASLTAANLGDNASGQMVSPAYRIQCQTVYEEQPVTTWRLQYETVLQEQQVTTQKPVWETEQRVRRVTVAKPVTETSTRIERHTVRRAVWDTETRTQQRTVRRPVTEQVMQSRNVVTCEPVTTMRTQLVDQGSWTTQWAFQPGRVTNRLQWLSSGWVPDPATGQMTFQRGGFHWVPTQAPGTFQPQQQWVSNVVEQQVAETTFQQRVVTEQVPVTVTRFVDEVIQEPIQVQVCRWVDEVVERPIQVTTQRTEFETREEPVQVQVCRWVTETRTVQVPHTVAKWVQQTSTRLVPRTVTMRVPIETCSPCTTLTPSQTTYYTPWAAAESTTIIDAAPSLISPPAASQQPTIANRAEGEAASQEKSTTGEAKDTDPTGKPKLNGNGRVVPNPLNGNAGEDATA